MQKSEVESVAYFPIDVIQLAIRGEPVIVSQDFLRCSVCFRK
jgi:hypothetical protein